MVYSCRELLKRWTTWPQWLAAFEVSLVGLCLGLASGWTSPFLAKLTSPESELPVTLDEASWIASLTPLGRVVGAIIGSIEVTYLGSKFSVLCAGIPIAMSWICLMIADTVNWIYAARSLQGICMGMLLSTFPLFFGEVTSPRIRGAVIGLIINSSAIGFIVGNLMGSLMSMWLFSVVSFIPALGFLIMFSFLPASPHFLVSRDRDDEAAAALVWYQPDVDVKKEIESLREFVNSRKSTGLSDILRELNVPRNRKALLMVTMIFILLQIGGTYAVGYYMEIMLRRAGVGTTVDPGMAVVGIGMFGITGGLLAMYANDKCGRKVVLAGSCCGLTCSLGVLGLQYVLLQQGLGLEWLPIVAMGATEFFINLGIGPVPSTIVSEFFSPQTKNVAASAANISSGLFAFVSTKTYQPMIDIMADQYVIWFYGIVMGILGIYTMLTLPETKGKTLQEIQEMLAKK